MILTDDWGLVNVALIGLAKALRLRAAPLPSSSREDCIQWRQAQGLRAREMSLVKLYEGHVKQLWHQIVQAEGGCRMSC